MFNTAMVMQSPPETLSLDELVHACQEQTARFRRAESSDPHFCLEIFRRALAHTPEPHQTVQAGVSPSSQQNSSVQVYDEHARTILVQIYTEYIKAHINPRALQSTSIDDLVQQVWLRFWQAANNGLSFTSLEGALAYLKLTVVSTLIEAQRREWKRTRDVSLQQVVDETGDVLDDPHMDLFLQHARQRFHQRCREILTDHLEYRIFWLRYGTALPPREIARHLANEGVLIKAREPTARLVSDTLDRICKRLCVDEEIRDLLRGD